MPTFVTGATGFLGRHLVPLLVERGDDVRALVRVETDDSWLRELGVEVVRGALLDADAVRQAAAGCELVFHAAGLVAHERGDAHRLAAVNVNGVRTILTAVDRRARLVHVASYATIGPARSREERAHEDQPYPEEAAHLPYVASKRAGERLVLDAVAAGMDAVVANPGFLLGPDDPYRVSTWPVYRYLQGTLRVHTEGGLSVADARDVAAGLLQLAERGRTGERYILTAGEGNFAWPDFFARVAAVTGVRRRMLGLPPPVVRAASRLVPWPVKPGEIEAATFWWFATAAKAERELAFQPRPVDETIADTASQYS
ncbi:MAG: NAD-dependent epimerase/dehydratase family protein [Actinomycetota bacterium]|nr:NAD-dependent epimerase/dehydratase family protein [Actinomycetota bacterium]